MKNFIKIFLTCSVFATSGWAVDPDTSSDSWLINDLNIALGPEITNNIKNLFGPDAEKFSNYNFIIWTPRTDIKNQRILSSPSNTESKSWQEWLRKGGCCSLRVLTEYNIQNPSPCFNHIHEFFCKLCKILFEKIDIKLIA